MRARWNRETDKKIRSTRTQKKANAIPRRKTSSSTNGTDEEKKTSDYFSQLVSRYKRLQQNKIKAVRAVADDTLESIVCAVCVL